MIACISEHLIKQVLVCSYVSLYRKTQSIGGALRGLYDDVHPEVESLPLGGVFDRLLLEPLDQLQVLHHRPQIPGRQNTQDRRLKEGNERGSG